jgi:hypothetical protein
VIANISNLSGARSHRTFKSPDGYKLGRHIPASNLVP